MKRANSERGGRERRGAGEGGCQKCTCFATALSLRMFSRHREAAICMGRGWEGQTWKYQTDVVGQRWKYENRDDVFASVGIF